MHAQVIGAVCHGPAALVNVMVDGRPILAGKIVRAATPAARPACMQYNAWPGTHT